MDNFFKVIRNVPFYKDSPVTGTKTILEKWDLGCLFNLLPGLKMDFETHFCICPSLVRETADLGHDVCEENVPFLTFQDFGCSKVHHSLFFSVNTDFLFQKTLNPLQLHSVCP